MDGKTGKLLALVAAEVLLLGILMGERGRASEEPGESDGLSGTIRIMGSTSMEKLTDALAECFMDKYPNVTVTVQFTGSSAGIAAVAEGSADIGISSRNLREEEREKGLVENIVAIDGIALCVDPANPVTGLSMGQLADIYTGEITNWSRLGGSDTPIVTVGREAGSGTREAFEELLGIRDRCKYANELDGMGLVLARVTATPGAVGYISFDLPGASVLSLDGVRPTAENVKAGAYPLGRPFAMVTKGPLWEQEELVQAWFEFVYSEEGQNYAAEAGLIPVD